MLPLIYVRVFSSRLQPSRHSILIMKPQEEDPVFILGIYARSDRKQLWRLEKTTMALPALHQAIRSHSAAFDGKLPDKSLFAGHAPAKIDARRAALNSYFDMLLEAPMSEQSALALCHFFSTDAIGPEAHSLTPPTSTNASPASTTAPTTRPQAGPRARQRRDGYLTKRGKNFGGWKARWFVLDSSELRYYDSPGGPQIGVIRLINAQIGKQSQQPHESNSPPQGPEEDADNQYRHAFLVLEPKKKDSSALVRHVLCAESDDERDAWVEALLQYVDADANDARDKEAEKEQAKARDAAQESAPAPAPVEPAATREQLHAIAHAHARADGHVFNDQPSTRNNSVAGLPHPSDRKPSMPSAMPLRSQQYPQDTPVVTHVVQGHSYDSAVAGNAPFIGAEARRGAPSSPIVGHSANAAGHLPHKSSLDRVQIGKPTNAMAIPSDSSFWGLSPNPSGGKTPIKEKKRSLFGFRGRTSNDFEKAIQAAGNSNEGRQKSTGSPVFGLPLAEAVELSQPIGVNVALPAVVYRSIEYLRARGAVREEGIFRLSGSNITIKALRERFNTERDIKLLDEEYHDVHAVASLLKLYLRELPCSILTREYHMDFLKVLDLAERSQKVLAFNFLVHQLPKVNLELLRALCSFLNEINDTCDINKMNVRNSMSLKV